MTIHRSFAGVHTWYLNRIALRLAGRRSVSGTSRRSRIVVDVLAPDHPPMRAVLGAVGRRTTVEVPGGTQALQRLGRAWLPRPFLSESSNLLRSVLCPPHTMNRTPIRIGSRLVSKIDHGWRRDRGITPIDVESALAKNGDFNWYVAPAVAGGSGVEPGTPGHRVRVHGAIRRAQTAPPPGRGFLLAALNKKVAGSQRPACTRPSVCDLQSSGRHVIRTG